jgi:FdhE protein
MQRILERGQIERLGNRQFTRIRRPDPERTFVRRSQRLRALSDNHSIAGYLSLMAELADAQHAVAQTLRLDERALEFVASELPLDRQASLDYLPWRAVLTDLCSDLLEAAELPAAARSVVERLRAAGREQDAAWLTQQAGALLAFDRAAIDPATAPFVMAALQACWAHVAAERIPPVLDEVEQRTLCPICASRALVSVIAIDSDAPGYRFLHCSLCSTEWHYVRAQCCQCGLGRRISYKNVEGAAPSVRAECCDECSTYCKMIYPEHDPNVEPVADDLATLALDLLLAGAGYSRTSINPLYWQA